MLESSVAFTLFDKVLAGLGLLRAEKQQRSKKTDQALMALYSALSETQRYIREREGGTPQNFNKEMSIASLWSSASIPLRELDPELADKCFAKASYWLDIGIWDDDQIQATRELLLR